MEKEYGIQGRNGKQCRERYHNHLKGGINKEKWTPKEENDLIHLHAEHGNRWALISKLIPGRYISLELDHKIVLKTCFTQECEGLFAC